eukprot:TRINITY_DN11356_c0_g1_i3.p2 TRINITY_DN11356_c0_g1~~TRINITY_DN11356_c0_g1_i3.p2  ORF type:complete len:100 (-),score=4.27 TRINITY_DN11356_c0_g1_i3:31-330(-)
MELKMAGITRQFCGCSQCPNSYHGESEQQESRSLRRMAERFCLIPRNPIADPADVAHNFFLYQRVVNGGLFDALDNAQLNGFCVSEYFWILHHTNTESK